MSLDAADTTDSNGVFRVEPLTCEDCNALKFNGAARGYETGFRDCTAHVVPAWPDACASPIGRIGKVFIQHL
jgi:hypothetical protein